MEIPVTLAQKIVKTLEENIGYHINFMDKNGVIIASSESERIGDSHEVSLIVLRTKKPFITTAEMTYQHSREGIDLPVEIDDEIIGTIGITGASETVKVFGGIIKSMSELLIKNYLSDNKRHYQVERERLLVDHLLFSSSLPLTPEEEKQLLSLEKDRKVVVVWHNDNLSTSKFEMVDLFPYLKRMLQFDQHIISVSTDAIILIVATTVSEKRLVTIGKSSYLKDFSMGIGLPVTTNEALFDSYKMAEFIATVLTHTPVFSFRDLKEEYVLKTADSLAKMYYIHTVFESVSSKDLKSYQELLACYERCNGSIKEMAKELFVHKNTVQYRLNRITETTGYNPRVLTDFYYLKLALTTRHYTE